MTICPPVCLYSIFSYPSSRTFSLFDISYPELINKNILAHFTGSDKRTYLLAFLFLADFFSVIGAEDIVFLFLQCAREWLEYLLRSEIDVHGGRAPILFLLFSGSAQIYTSKSPRYHAHHVLTRIFAFKHYNPSPETPVDVLSLSGYAPIRLVYA